MKTIHCLYTRSCQYAIALEHVYANYKDEDFNLYSYVELQLFKTNSGIDGTFIFFFFLSCNKNIRIKINIEKNIVNRKYSIISILDRDFYDFYPALKLFHNVWSVSTLSLVFLMIKAINNA